MTVPCSKPEARKGAAAGDDAQAEGWAGKHLAQKPWLFTERINFLESSPPLPVSLSGCLMKGRGGGEAEAPGGRRPHRKELLGLQNKIRGLGENTGRKKKKHHHLSK